MPLSTEKLNEFRTKSNFSVEQVAEKTGIELEKLEKLFSGESHHIEFEKLLRIAELFGCRFEDFLFPEEGRMSDLEISVMRAMSLCRKEYEGGQN